ncbi:MAG: tRNA 4-thiouridine(8) synthase ThiI [Clostridia bacterium]|nr:tRNA 4-thiouridine(8) synthase ThiI [Clostridia bacterium]
MRELILVRYGEIFLKGLNRPYFMRALVDKVKNAVQPLGGKVMLRDGRILVTDAEDMQAALEAVTKVFGVHSACIATEVEKEDFNVIAQTAIKLMKGMQGSFRVESRRSDKKYPMQSPDINRELGYRILNAYPELHVDLHHPDHTLNVEIREQAYLYCRVVQGVGGMPVGTNGKATLLLSGGIDSPVAGWMIAKRGVQISAVHFHSYPYTSDRAKEKVLDLARILSASCCGIRVYVVPFTEIQMAIHEKCPQDYTTLIMRRYMMRIAEKCAEREKAGALITGESIGQVASQTMEALGATNSVVHMPVFRPLIGFDKSDITEIAVKIGTYDTSILPYEDCCTVFTPRHPATHPRMATILKGEELLDSDALIQRALDGIEIVEV